MSIPAGRVRVGGEGQARCRPTEEEDHEAVHAFRVHGRGLRGHRGRDAADVQGRRRRQPADQVDGRLGVRRRAAPGRDRHRRHGQGRRRPHHRRPLRRGQGAAGRLLGHQGAPTSTRPWRGRRKATVACQGAVEVRPFQDDAEAEAERWCRAAEVERVFRHESGRAVAVLVRLFGDIDVAEEAVQEAFVVALRTLARDGLSRPAPPAGSSPPPATGPSTACGGSRPATTATPRPRSCRPLTSPRRWDPWKTTACA